jgi:hypothetical protein
VSRDVVFDENDFPFSQLHPNAGSQLKSKNVFLPPVLCNSHEHGLVDGQGANGANPSAEHVVQAEEILGKETEVEVPTHESSTSASNNTTDPLAAPDPNSASSSDLVPSIRQGLPSDHEPGRRPGLVPTGSSLEHEPGRWSGQMLAHKSQTNMRQDQVNSCVTPILHSSGSGASSDHAIDSVAQQNNSSSSVASQGISLDIPTPPIANQPRTHLQDNIVKKKVFTDGMV